MTSKIGWHKDPKPVDEDKLEAMIQAMAVSDGSGTVKRLDWFNELFGVEENGLEAVRDAFALEPESDDGVDGAESVSVVCPNKDKSEFRCGRFETPSVADLRARVGAIDDCPGIDGTTELTVDHIAVSNVMDLHSEDDNLHATFQVASQFNCLEFPNAHTLPEHGIQGYIFDYTQGPACALACPAGTLYRNYFVKVDPAKDERGQSKENQVQNLKPVEDLVHNGDARYWDSINGYVQIDVSKMEALDDLLCSDAALRNRIQESLCVGVQHDTQVILRSSDDKRRFTLVSKERPQLVTQVYCSALSLMYAADTAASLARLVQLGAYEATLLLAILNAQAHDWSPSSRNVYLTLVGGGAFKNEYHWIHEAIAKMCVKYRMYGLKVYVVHHKKVHKEKQEECTMLLERELIAQS